MSTVPITSLESYRALTPKKLSGDYAKIINGLKAIGSGTYEQLSDFIGCREPNVISRRLKEIEIQGLIFKTGEKRKTKRNRNAFVYCLTNNQPTTDNQQKEAFKSTKPILEYLKNIEGIKSTFIQPNLFE